MNTDIHKTYVHLKKQDKKNFYLSSVWDIHTDDVTLGRSM